MKTMLFLFTFLVTFLFTSCSTSLFTIGDPFFKVCEKSATFYLYASDNRTDNYILEIGHLNLNLFGVGEKASCRIDGAIYYLDCSTDGVNSLLINIPKNILEKISIAKTVLIKLDGYSRMEGVTGFVTGDFQSEGTELMTIAQGLLK